MCGMEQWMWLFVIILLSFLIVTSTGTHLAVARTSSPGLRDASIIVIL
jgi:hypothetical protein